MIIFSDLFVTLQNVRNIRQLYFSTLFEIEFLGLMQKES